VESQTVNHHGLSQRLISVRFVKKLKATADGDGTLLDHSAILYGGALSDGNAHSNFDLPLVVAGHMGGIRGGRYVAAEAKTPVANFVRPIAELRQDGDGALRGQHRSA
jgi:hypothetical protein